MSLKQILSEKNVGKREKQARLSIGALLFMGGAFGGMPLVGLVGLVFAITGLRENCPINAILKRK